MAKYCTTHRRPVSTRSKTGARATVFCAVDGLNEAGWWLSRSNQYNGIYVYMVYMVYMYIYIGIYIYSESQLGLLFIYTIYIYIEGITIGIVTWNIYHIYHYNEIQPTDEFPCDFGWENDAFNGANGWSNHSLVSFKDYPLINIQIAIENGHRNSEFSH